MPKEGRGAMLITSQDSNLLGEFDGKELSVMSESNAVDLLINLARYNTKRLSAADMNAAKEIVKRTGYLPLGIRQAAALIVNEPCPLPEFLGIFDEEDLIKKTESIELIQGRSNHYPKTLATVWDMCFRRLEEHPGQAEMLNIMAFCDADRFQISLLSKMDGSKDPSLAFINSRKKVHDCRVGLVRSSLVHENFTVPQSTLDRSLEFTKEEAEATSRELGLHRLVQASCRIRMTAEDRRHFFKTAIALIKASWPVPPRNAVHNPSLWREQQRLLPHVEALCQHYVNSCREEQPLIAHEEVNWDFPHILYEAGW